ncbi:Protein of unknown function [Cotesia congregata]|uniref:Uncharacterized protein n=1 Tax=Cotesia congregata TaxID=51543 RepID=A0A8J2H4U8_COTCN|nr:Protein of unknown function [Cotesia congregata]
MGTGKREIMEKKRRLKGKKIFIENDRTRKERNAQKELHRRAWIAKNKEEVKEVKVGFRKLWLDGVLWRTLHLSLYSLDRSTDGLICEQLR